jgi:hypothetical protein
MYGEGDVEGPGQGGSDLQPPNPESQTPIQRLDREEKQELQMRKQEVIDPYTPNPQPPTLHPKPQTLTSEP